MAPINRTGTGSSTTATTGATTSTVTGAAGIVATGDAAWWVVKPDAPPKLDRAVTAQVMHQCNAEVGQCLLVVQVDDAEAARLRASAAQYSDLRVNACIRALGQLGTAADLALAVEVDRQASDISELGVVQRAHIKVQGSYGTTIAKRGVYLMDQVRVQEERILLLGAQERLKATPDANILTAASQIEDARAQEAGKRQSTQKDHESRAADKDAEIARLQGELGQMRKMNEELLQGLAQMKAQGLTRDAGQALGGSVAAAGGAGGAVTSSGDRRQGGR